MVEKQERLWDDDEDEETSLSISRNYNNAEFNRRKAELRSLYKKYKVGMVNGEDLTDEERFLLTKYYGVRYEK